MIFFPYRTFRAGPLEIVIVALIVILIFGIGRLPLVAQSLGRALRSIRISALEGLLKEDTKKKATKGKKRQKRSKKKTV